MKDFAGEGLGTSSEQRAGEGGRGQANSHESNPNRVSLEHYGGVARGGGALGPAPLPPFLVGNASRKAKHFT